MAFIELLYCLMLLTANLVNRANVIMVLMFFWTIWNTALILVKKYSIFSKKGLFYGNNTGVMLLAFVSYCISILTLFSAALSKMCMLNNSPDLRNLVQRTVRKVHLARCGYQCAHCVRSCLTCISNWSWHGTNLCVKCTNTRSNVLSSISRSWLLIGCV